MKNNSAYIGFVALVMLVCVLPIALMLAGVTNTNRENRPLASKPKLIKDGELNLKFSSDFDNYLNDNFVLKEHYVTALNSASVALFGEAVSDKAICGRNNMLFYKDTLDDYQRLNQLSDKELEGIALYMRELETQLSEKGCRMVFLIAPNKATVYPEYMPSRYKQAPAKSNLDRLYEYLDKYGVTSVDAKAVLTEHKSDTLLYYYHDSHWNNMGAELIYNEIADLTELPAFDNAGAAGNTIRDFTGDLHNFVWPAKSYFEERMLYEFTSEYSADRPIDFERNSCAATSSDVNDLKLVVYHDSFGRSLQPFFSHSAGRVVMSSEFPYNMSYIDEVEPDIVIIEIVERNIDYLLKLAD